MTKIRKITYLIIIGLIFIIPIQTRALIGITLTWSADTYVPLSYPGKALPSRGSNIEVVANIDSPGINSKELIFNWFLNDHIQKSNSGQGKQVFKFNIGESITKNHSIKVEIKNKQGDHLGASSYLFLKPSEPQIVIEARIPLSSSFSLTPKYQISSEQEVTFTAQPYFFNIQNLNGLDYTWNLGDQTASQINDNNPNIFILKIGELAQIIKQSLNVWVKNKSNPIQRTQTTAEITLIP